MILDESLCKSRRFMSNLFLLEKTVHVVGKNWMKLASVADQCFQSLVLKDV